MVATNNRTATTARMATNHTGSIWQGSGPVPEIRPSQRQTKHISATRLNNSYDAMAFLGRRYSKTPKIPDWSCDDRNYFAGVAGAAGEGVAAGVAGAVTAVSGGAGGGAGGGP